MIRRPPRSTHCISSAASDVYKRQQQEQDLIGMDDESAAQRRIQDSGKIDALYKELGIKNPRGGKTWSECLNLGPEIGEDLAYLWALESEAGHGLII